jgi:lipopolysaccharide export system protein LptC
MSVQDQTIHPSTHRRTGGYLVAGAERQRLPPTPRRLARRHWLITVTKWLLPTMAMALLASIALWPEIDAVTSGARVSIRELSGQVQGGKLIDARYAGVDANGRPYTVTAATASQVAPQRILLTMPKGDITLANGTWLMLTALNGTYLQNLNQLDLVNNVTLYRDDGTVVHTASAAIDLKAGAAAGSQPVHVEGPFGVLDAEGFTVLDKGTSIDFTGPAHVVLNGSDH